MIAIASTTRAAMHASEIEEMAAAMRSPDPAVSNHAYAKHHVWRIAGTPEWLQRTAGNRAMSRHPVAARGPAQYHADPTKRAAARASRVARRIARAA